MKNITTLGRYYKRGLEKIIPGYAVISLLTCLMINNVIYFGIQRLMAHATHYDLSLPLDRQIPLQTGWIVVYWFCYIFWGFNYILTSHQGREHWFRFATADLISRFICGAIFILLPTTLTRPDVVGGGLFEQAVRLLYQLDAPTNLFPSVHCLVSWFCYLGIRGQKKVPKWYQYVTLFYCFLVFASVLFTRQHVIVDIFGGVFIAQACYYLATYTDIYRPFMHFFDRITSHLLGAGYDK